VTPWLTPWQSRLAACCSHLVRVRVRVRARVRVRVRVWVRVRVRVGVGVRVRARFTFRPQSILLLDGSLNRLRRSLPSGRVDLHTAALDERSVDLVPTLIRGNVRGSVGRTPNPNVTPALPLTLTHLVAEHPLRVEREDKAAADTLWLGL